MVPDLQNIVVVLLKLLLSTVTANNSTTKGESCLSSSNPEALEEVDAVRNREILSKAISAIVLLLLKWTKVSRTCVSGLGWRRAPREN